MPKTKFEFFKPAPTPQVQAPERNLITLPRVNEEAQKAIDAARVQQVKNEMRNAHLQVK